MEQPQPANGQITEQPLAYRAVRNGVWVALGSYWVNGFGFVANIALIRLLTPAIYGEFALAMFFYTLFDLQSKVGLNFAFAQQREVNGETIGTLAILSVVMGAGTLLLALLATPVLLALGYAPMTAIAMLAMCILSFAGSWVMPFAIVFEANLHYKPLSVATALATPLSYGPAFWLAWQGMGQYSLASQTVTYTVLVLMGILAYVFFARRDLLRLRWRYRPALARQYLSFGTPTGLSTFVANLLTSADNFILGTLAGTTTLGYYDRAYRLAQWPTLLLNTVIERAAVFTYSQVRESAQQLQRSVTMMLWISANVAIPVALTLFLSAPDLVMLLYGEQWTPAVPLLRLLLIAAVLRPLWENSRAILVGIGEPRWALGVSVMQLVLLAIIGTLLTATLSAGGTAVAVTLALGIAFATAYRLFSRHLEMKLWPIFAGPLAAAALTCAAYLILVRLLDTHDSLWLSVAWKMGWGASGFFLFALLLQPKQFTAQISYLWRLWRRQPASAMGKASQKE